MTWPHSNSSATYLPIGVHNGAIFLPHELVIPDPRLWVDRFSYRAQDLQTGEIVFVHEALTKLHEGTDGGGGCVKLCHLVLGNYLKYKHRCTKCQGIGHSKLYPHYLPEPLVGRVEGSAFEQHRRGPIQQRPICYIGVSSDPAYKC